MFHLLPSQLHEQGGAREAEQLGLEPWLRFGHGSVANSGLLTYVFTAKIVIKNIDLYPIYKQEKAKILF